ncbi:MAG: hypothetical protein QXJ75_00730 [Candidatus Bathyarchaeia archaeon]
MSTSSDDTVQPKKIEIVQAMTSGVSIRNNTTERVGVLIQFYRGDKLVQELEWLAAEQGFTKRAIPLGVTSVKVTSLDRNTVYDEATISAAPIKVAKTSKSIKSKLVIRRKFLVILLWLLGMILLLIL